MIKIESDIVDYKIVEPIVVSKKKHRPLLLHGTTYKLRTHVYDHSFYVTINDFENTPFEIFINTRNEDSTMWIVSQTLSWSAIFREMSDITFLINGMLKVVDPRGAHQSHERFHKSIVAEIGYILDCRIKGVSLKKSDRNKKEQNNQPEKSDIEQTNKPVLGLSCPKCNQFTLIKIDGCDKCLNDDCRHSSCE